MWMIAAGFLAVFNEFFFFQSLHLGMPVGIGKLIFGVGSVLFLLVIGFFFFKEELDAIKILGIVLSIVGFYLMLR